MQFQESSFVLNNSSLVLLLRYRDVSKLAALRGVNCRLCFTSRKICTLSAVIDCLPTFIHPVTHHTFLSLFSWQLCSSFFSIHFRLSHITSLFQIQLSYLKSFALTVHMYSVKIRFNVKLNYIFSVRTAQ